MLTLKLEKRPKKDFTLIVLGIFTSDGPYIRVLRTKIIIYKGITHNKIMHSAVRISFLQV